MTYITLSHTLEQSSPVHMALKEPEIKPNSQISKGGGYNSYIINVENHSGTHVDAPGHFLENTKIISDYTPDELVFNNPLILNIPKGQNELIKLEEISDLNLDDKDCIVFKTHFGKYQKDDPETYLNFNPGIGPDLIYWIRKNYPLIRCIGIDCISISASQKPEEGKKAHLNAFMGNEELGEPLLLVEDMKLDTLKNLDSIKSIIVVPWQIKGIDSAPCTVLARIKK
ncbi:cyclase family protein [Methanobacterium sp. ACI-7]|uniref:cyclase family protein n=1 Tax=unclassified Methanobacterium TaxID=2627676 RepID=UPI0039C34624